MAQFREALLPQGRDLLELALLERHLGALLAARPPTRPRA